MILHRQVFMNIKIAKKIVFGCMLVGMTCFLNATEVTPKDMPPLEKSFIKIMKKATNEYASTTNELKKQKINFDLSKSVFNLLKDGSAKDWVGIIGFINTDNSDGSAGLSIIPLGEENSFSPIVLGTATDREVEKKFGINTRISIGTHLYDVLSELEVGDKVVFSGHFIPSGVGILEITEDLPESEAGMATFTAPRGIGLFKFTDIKKITSVKKSK